MAKIISDTGREVRDVDARQALQKLACQREKKHSTDPYVLNSNCDGEHLVCGKCGTTAWQMLDAIKAL